MAGSYLADCVSCYMVCYNFLIYFPMSFDFAKSIYFRKRKKEKKFETRPVGIELGLVDSLVVFT